MGEEKKRGKKVNRMSVAEVVAAIKHCREQKDVSSDYYRMLEGRLAEGKDAERMTAEEAMAELKLCEEIGDRSSAVYQALRYRLIRK